MSGLNQLGLIAGLLGDAPWRDADRLEDRPRTRPRKRREPAEEFLLESAADERGESLQ